MAINLDKMKAKLDTSRNGGRSQNNTKWRPSEGDQTIRLLPAEDGDPFKEYHFHYNVGRNPGILCPKKNFGGSLNNKTFSYNQQFLRGSLK